MSLGPAEILVVVVVVLVCISPRRPPEAARHLGPAGWDGRRGLAHRIVAGATNAVGARRQRTPKLSSPGTLIRVGSGRPVGADGTAAGLA